MATILNVPQRAYAAGTHDMPLTVSASLTNFVATLTRVSWPVGDVLSASVIWSDGSGSAVTLVGGDQPGLFGGIQTTSQFSASKPAGITSGTLSVNVIQPITTAVTVDAT